MAGENLIFQQNYCSLLYINFFFKEKVATLEIHQVTALFIRRVFHSVFFSLAENFFCLLGSHFAFLSGGFWSGGSTWRPAASWNIPLIKVSRCVVCVSSGIFFFFILRFRGQNIFDRWRDWSIDCGYFRLPPSQGSARHLPVQIDSNPPGIIDDRVSVSHKAMTVRKVLSAAAKISSTTSGGRICWAISAVGLGPQVEILTVNAIYRRFYALPPGGAEQRGERKRKRRRKWVGQNETIFQWKRCEIDESPLTVAITDARCWKWQSPCVVPREFVRPCSLFTSRWR